MRPRVCSRWKEDGRTDRRLDGQDRKGQDGTGQDRIGQDGACVCVCCVCGLRNSKDGRQAHTHTPDDRWVVSVTREMQRRLLVGVLHPRIASALQQLVEQLVLPVHGGPVQTRIAGVAVADTSTLFLLYPRSTQRRVHQRTCHNPHKCYQAERQLR